MAEENIKINKKLYSRSDVNNVIDLTFSELFEKDNRATDIKIKNLFQEYNSIFYDIPKTGILSHSTLFIQSRDYINDFYDPKDDQIEALLDRIETLEDELVELSNAEVAVEKEHPVYSNGTFLKVEGGHSFFMYKGEARRVRTVVKKILKQKYQPGRDTDEYQVVLSSAADLPSRGYPDLTTASDLNDLK